MKALIIILAVMALLSASCSYSMAKILPEHDGVDPRAQSLLDEYLWLSRQNHIHFKRDVTIGFKRIGRGDTVGLCTFGHSFREIDIDLDYWKSSTKTTRMTLVYHELTHCLCERKHDYGKDKNYPETQEARIAQAKSWKANGGPRPGFWEDGCPTSLMYPVVLDDDCMRAHYDQYTREMFERCSPW